MEDREDEVTAEKLFLNKFSECRAALAAEEEAVHYRIGSPSLAEHDFEGEVTDWALQYLYAHKCPYNLAAAVAYATCQEVKSSDLQSVAHQNGQADGEAVFDSNKLLKLVHWTVHDICERWMATPTKAVLPPTWPVAITAVKNGRRRMEDRHVVISDLGLLYGVQCPSPRGFFAVFDGHAGPDAATYAAAHLHHNIVRQPTFVTNLVQAIKDGFQLTDEHFICKSKQENLKSGSTAVCAIVEESTVHVAWLGDSQAILARQGGALNLVTPHKPERADERERIERLGGCVMLFGTWRVNGTLAVSRAIGDAEFKPYVSAEPDVVSIPRDGTEDFLIVACDGLWDVMSGQDAANIVYAYLVKKPDDLEGAAHKLVQLSVARGSNDNISVIVVLLRDVASIVASMSCIPESPPATFRIPLAASESLPEGLKQMIENGESPTKIMPLPDIGINEHFTPGSNTLNPFAPSFTPSSARNGTHDSLCGGDLLDFCDGSGQEVRREISITEQVTTQSVVPKDDGESSSVAAQLWISDAVASHVTEVRNVSTINPFSSSIGSSVLTSAQEFQEYFLAQPGSQTVLDMISTVPSVSDGQTQSSALQLSSFDSKPVGSPTEPPPVGGSYDVTEAHVLSVDIPFKVDTNSALSDCVTSVELLGGSTPLLLPSPPTHCPTSPSLVTATSPPPIPERPPSLPPLSPTPLSPKSPSQISPMSPPPVPSRSQSSTPEIGLPPTSPISSPPPMISSPPPIPARSPSSISTPPLTENLPMPFCAVSSQRPTASSPPPPIPAISPTRADSSTPPFTSGRVSLPPTPTTPSQSSPPPIPAASPPPVPAASPPPVPAASPPPVSAASPPPVSAASPTPVSAASPTPVPAASPPPVPAASPPPIPAASPPPIPAASPPPIPAASPPPVAAASPPPIAAASPPPIPARSPVSFPGVLPFASPVTSPTAAPQTSMVTSSPVVSFESAPPLDIKVQQSLLESMVEVIPQCADFNAILTLTETNAHMLQSKYLASGVETLQNEPLSMDPITVEVIPETLPVSDDVVDDESEDGEGWRYFQGGSRQEDQKGSDTDRPGETLTTTVSDTVKQKETGIGSAVLMDTRVQPDLDTSINSFGARSTEHSESLEVLPLDTSSDACESSYLTLNTTTTEDSSLIRLTNDHVEVLAEPSPEAQGLLPIVKSSAETTANSNAVLPESDTVKVTCITEVPKLPREKGAPPRETQKKSSSQTTKDKQPGTKQAPAPAKTTTSKAPPAKTTATKNPASPATKPAASSRTLERKPQAKTGLPPTKSSAASSTISSPSLTSRSAARPASATTRRETVTTTMSRQTTSNKPETSAAGTLPRRPASAGTMPRAAPGSKTLSNGLKKTSSSAKPAMGNEVKSCDINSTTKTNVSVSRSASQTKTVASSSKPAPRPPASKKSSAVPGAKSDTVLVATTANKLTKETVNKQISTTVRQTATVKLTSTTVRQTSSTTVRQTSKTTARPSLTSRTDTVATTNGMLTGSKTARPSGAPAKEMLKKTGTATLPSTGKVPVKKAGAAMTTPERKAPTNTRPRKTPGSSDKPRATVPHVAGTSSSAAKGDSHPPVEPEKIGGGTAVSEKGALDERAKEPPLEEPNQLLDHGDELGHTDGILTANGSVIDSIVGFGSGDSSSTTLVSSQEMV